jgi:hypothetical protein
VVGEVEEVDIDSALTVREMIGGAVRGLEDMTLLSSPAQKEKGRREWCGVPAGMAVAGRMLSGISVVERETVVVLMCMGAVPRRTARVLGYGRGIAGISLLLRVLADPDGHGVEPSLRNVVAFPTI